MTDPQQAPDPTAIQDSLGTVDVEAIPASDAGGPRESLPLPVATSRTFQPAWRSADSQSISAENTMRAAIMEKSPVAQVACCFCLMAEKSGVVMTGFLRSSKRDGASHRGLS